RSPRWRRIRLPRRASPTGRRAHQQPAPPPAARAAASDLLASEDPVIASLEAFASQRLITRDDVHVTGCLRDGVGFDRRRLTARSARVSGPRGWGERGY